MEYELLDTGIFDDDRYFDVVVEYAKDAHDDILMLVTALQPRTRTRRRSTCSRRCGSATPGRGATRSPSRPSTALDGAPGVAAARASHAELGEWLSARRRVGAAAVLRERDQQRAPVRGAERLAVRQGRRSTTSSSHGAADAVNPERTGTKVAAHHVLELAPGDSASVRLRLTASARSQTAAPATTPLGRRLRSRVLERPRKPRPTSSTPTVIPPTLDRRRGDGDAPGAGRAAVGQAVLRVRRAPLAARARRQPVGPERPGELGAQRAVVPHGRRRRDLDARQVGVPVVRRVGPGVPLRAAVARRRRLRQGADRAAARRRATCIPTARSRRTSGTSATSTRP